MYFLKKIALLLIIVVLIGCSGCREYNSKETKEIYQNNSEIFEQVVDICEKYQVSIPVSDYKPYYTYRAVNSDCAVDKSALTREERSILQKCGDNGCESVYYNLQNGQIRSSRYVDFKFRYGSWNQGIIVFTDDVDELYYNFEPVTLEEYLKHILLWNKYIEYEELDDNTYYYRAWGDSRVSDSSGLSDLSSGVIMNDPPKS